MIAQRTARGVALAALSEWRRGRRFADAIAQQMLTGSMLRGSDRAFVTELLYGVLRNLSLLDFWIAQLRPGSIDDMSRDLLRLGLYQLFRLDIPSHAAVFETVALAPKTSRAFVNGVLRTAARRRAEMEAAAAAASLAVRSSHPEFLVAKWTKTFGAPHSAQLCDWNNQPPLLYARVNRLKISVEDFLAAPASCELLPAHRNFVRIRTLPMGPLERGECYIQDPSTTAACELLDPQPGETVLDACAAPGGKTAYLAELMKNEGTLIACDRDPARLDLLALNLQRLGVTNAHVQRQDWTSGSIAPGVSDLRYDRILVDAPCSNTGVMRRRVDVRWRLRGDEFVRMAAEQTKIMHAVVPLLKPGGTIVYSTCSIEPEENSGVVAAALQAFPFLRVESESDVLPFRDHFDGAYAAKLIRAA